MSVARTVSPTLAVALLLLLPPPGAAQRDGCRDLEPQGSEIRVADDDEPGERLVITGRTVAADGETPLAGLRVRVYHTDAEGFYSRGGMDESQARLCGVLATDAEGGYRVETIRPAPYATGGPPPHVHFDVTDVAGRSRLLTVFLPAEATDGGDPAAGERSSPRRPLVRRDDGTLELVFDLQLR